MESNERLKAVAAIVLVTVFMGALLFLSAGTMYYWRAWIFLAVYIKCTGLLTYYLLKYDPALFARRMQMGEKRPAQRVVMSVMTSVFVGLLVVSGLDHRFEWSQMPFLLSVIMGNALIWLSFVAFFLVFRENSFAASTIEIAEEQTVISTGPYSFVRHPMYTGGALFLLGIPIALGSVWALLVLLPAIPVMWWRIVDEEALLRGSLPGYNEYCAQVKYRLIPGLY